jgi:hypothetical protein
MRVMHQQAKLIVSSLKNELFLLDGCLLFNDTISI